MCISPFISGTETRTAYKETSSSLGISIIPVQTVSHKSQSDCGGVHGANAPVAEESCDRDEVVLSETLQVPIIKVETVQPPPSLDPFCRALDETLREEGLYEVMESSGRLIGPSSASYFKSNGPQVIRCFQVAS